MRPQLCFDIWKLALHHDRLKKQMRVNSKQKRKEKIRKIMHYAQCAAQAKDQYMFFQHIRQLAPKQPCKRIMLRGDHGALLSPTDSAECIAEWIHQLYDGVGPPTKQGVESWPFSTDELYDAFRSFPSTKALSPEYIPALLWKTHASQAANSLQTLANSSYQHYDLPEQWGSGTLIFLAKPGKPSHVMANLCTIPLLEPTGKAIFGALSRAIIAACWHQLCSGPQYAYYYNVAALLLFTGYPYISNRCVIQLHCVCIPYNKKPLAPLYLRSMEDSFCAWTSLKRLTRWTESFWLRHRYSWMLHLRFTGYTGNSAAGWHFVRFTGEIWVGDQLQNHSGSAAQRLPHT